MSRRDFENLVAWLRAHWPDHSAREPVADSMAHMLNSNYAHFDREKFMRKAMK